MKIKNLIDEDFVNYKKPSMFIAMPHCTFKCCNEAGCDICQNSPLAKTKEIEIGVEKLIDRYLDNPITESVVFGGLEPLDDLVDLIEFINAFRKVSNDDIVIYTGYREDEVQGYVRTLKAWPNIIVKFGRFIPFQVIEGKYKFTTHFDEVLGVDLASDNQHAIKIS